MWSGWPTTSGWRWLSSIWSGSATGGSCTSTGVTSRWRPFAEPGSWPRPPVSTPTSCLAATTRPRAPPRRALLADLPTAVVTANDRSAIGLLDVFVRAGVRVPEDVSVVGYDDSALARLTHIELTTVSQEAPRQAARAVAAALERLDDGRVEPTESVLPPRLVVRGTTAPSRTSCGLP
jgi:Periplasmic binding protein-like domain